ncbi:MAG TPA: EcsC family protein [Methylocystis sp.]|nr:EcsC family protein [Methylocystis sp.]
MSARPGELSKEHRLELARAYKLLERVSLATTLAEWAGKPLQSVLSQIPAPLREKAERAIEKAILECLKVAVNSFRDAPEGRARTRLAALSAGLAGGVGGLFGAAALPLELPVTTILMLRAIADIARHYGEDLSSLEARLACVEVFAHGAEKREDMGYYASRALLGRLSADLSALLLQKGAAGAAAPATAALSGEVASRFGMVVWERAAASALPLAGAAGAASINVAFMNHFQRVARGHFMVRRLERIYGVETVRRRYEALVAADRERTEKAREKQPLNTQRNGI